MHLDNRYIHTIKIKIIESQKEWIFNLVERRVVD